MTAHPRPRHPAGSEPGDTAHRAAPAVGKTGGTGRWRFLGYLLAAPTLVAAAELGRWATSARTASAAVPSGPQPSDIIDLNDILTDATRPTANLITVTIKRTGPRRSRCPAVSPGRGSPPRRP